MGPDRQLHSKGPVRFDPVDIDHPFAVGHHEVDRLPNFIRHTLHHLVPCDMMTGGMQKTRCHKPRAPRWAQFLAIFFPGQKALPLKLGAETVNGLLGQADRFVDFSGRQRTIRRPQNLQDQQCA